MNTKQYNAFVKAINEHQYDMPELKEDEQPLVLETAYQYYQYQYTTENMELKEYRRNSFATLRKRSSMPEMKPLNIKGEDPSLSHSSFQIAITGGAYNHRRFEQINIRPAYTSLTDNNWGLIKGAGISVLENSWRYYNQKHKLVLNKLTGLQIYSLVPSDRIFSPWSYTTNMDIHRAYNPQKTTEGYVGEISFGMGKTYALNNYLWLYGILESTGQYGGFIPHNQWIGITPEIGLFSDIERLRLHTSMKKIFATRNFGAKLKVETDMAFEIYKNFTINLLYSNSNNEHGHDEHELSGGIKYSF